MKRLKPATEKLFELRDKLQALADRGVNGEKIAAQAKLRRLEASVDFSTRVMRTEDIFKDVKVRFCGEAVFLFRFEPGEPLEAIDFCKWAIESVTGANLLYRGQELWAQVRPNDAATLGTIVKRLADGFRTLWFQLARSGGVFETDRRLFARGLYDGLVGEKREGLLPARIIPKLKSGTPKRLAVKLRDNPTLHPYSLACPLGKQLRFSVALEEIAGELEEKITLQLKS